jgi:hypothetical protein
MVALSRDGGVDSAGVDLEIVKLLFGNSRDGPVGGGTQLESSLDAVMLEEGRPEDLGQLTGGVPAEGVHLEEAILGGDEALGEDEVVERGGSDVGDAVGIALDSDRRGYAGYSEFAIHLRERCRQQVLNIAACGEEGGESNDKKDGDGYGEELRESA